MANVKAARVVLQDLQRALKKHNDRLQGEDFRISWVTIVTLLRTVGYVLSNVDGESDHTLKAVIEKEYEALKATKPLPEIFWSFIDEERNNILKEYQFGVSRTYDVGKVPGREMYAAVDLGKMGGGEIVNMDVDKVQSIISEGPFKGRKEIDVAWEAYKWWESYLDEIDRQASAKSPTA